MKASVVIPMFNARKTIGICLQALEKQTLKDFEVIVVDDGSTDGCRSIVEEFARKNSLQPKILSQENKGPAAARNLGASSASGEVIVFLDADCVPNVDWFEKMMKFFDDPSVAGVQGAYETLNREHLVARYAGYEIERRHEGMKAKKSLDLIASFSTAFRKETFLSVGGFDVSYREANAEDGELSFRMRTGGYRLVFSPDAVVAHPHPHTLWIYLRQQFRRGYWRIPLYIKYRNKIFRDSYTGNELFIQGLLAVIFFTSLILPDLRAIFLSSALLLTSNIPLGLYCSKREKKLFFIAPVIASVRSLTGLLGAVYGVLFFVFLKPLRKCVS